MAGPWDTTRAGLTRHAHLHCGRSSLHATRPAPSPKCRRRGRTCRRSHRSRGQTQGICEASRSSVSSTKCSRSGPRTCLCQGKNAVRIGALVCRVPCWCSPADLMLGGVPSVSCREPSRTAACISAEHSARSPGRYFVSFIPLRIPPSPRLAASTNTLVAGSHRASPQLLRSTWGCRTIPRARLCGSTRTRQSSLATLNPPSRAETPCGRSPARVFSSTR